MKAVLLLIVLLFSQTVAANDVSDLEKTMKSIGLAYKQSVEATQLAEFNSAIDRFIELIAQGKQAKFYKEAEKSVQGLDKVLAQAQLAKKVANEQGLEAAKQPLKAIDNLRKKYHKLHEPPGFFELLFGK
ncbi:cytochrome b562 [Pseudoalteromonas sp.]|uniref:cytochrome b562 n=1 Tax=Pseudoalteromonas sp. TaxID=53249 RepID=UPI001BCF4351|nr:cytochrome b562 [Pseudoalteromonas sp.]